MLHEEYERFMSSSWMRDGLKVVEEMAELSTRIMQQVNKPNKNLHSKIWEEISDVSVKLKTFAQHYMPDNSS